LPAGSDGDDPEVTGRPAGDVATSGDPVFDLVDGLPVRPSVVAVAGLATAGQVYRVGESGDRAVRGDQVSSGAAR
jgi:hypothetical protein